MNNIRIVLISVFIGILFSCNNNLGIDDYEKRNEKWCWLVDNETGIGSWVQDGDRTKAKNSTYSMFYSNGMLRQKGTLVDNKECDTTTFFGISGDTLRLAYNDEKGIEQEIVSDGTYEWHYATGELAHKGEYLNNKPIGLIIYYFKNGQINYMYNYENDTVLSLLEYDENRQLIDSFVKVNDSIIGQRKQWFGNGNIKYIGEYINGEMVYAESYDENGMLLKKTNNRQ